MLATIVDQSPHAAPFGAGDDDVADVQRAALDQHGRDRATAAIELRFHDDAFRGAVGIGLEVEHLGLQDDRLEELVEVQALQRRNLDLERVAAHRFHHDAVLEEVGAHARRIGVRLVDLVDRHDDRHLGGARVVDGFDRLRHHPVIGCDHQHGDIGRLRAAGAHGRERLVAGRVDEGDLLAVLLDLVGADVLRDAAGLGGDDIGLPDGVEQRRLAVVDMAHDGDHGRARLHRVGRVGRVEQALLDVGSGDAANAVAELLGNQLRGVRVENVGDLHHRAGLHEQPDHVDRALRHAVGELLHGNRLGNDDVADDLLLCRIEAVLLPQLLLTLAADRGERTLAVVVERIGDGEAAAAAVVARRGLGARRLRHLDALRAQRRGDGANDRLGVAGGRCGGGGGGSLGRAVLADGHCFLAQAAAGLVLGAAARLVLGLLAGLLVGLAALGLGALAGEPLLLLAAVAGIDLGLAALLGLAHPRFGQRVGAGVALLVGERAQHDAAGARPRLGLRLSLRLLRLGRAGIGPAQLRRLRRAHRLDRPRSLFRSAGGKLGPLAGRRHAAALLLHQHGLRPPARKALAHGVGVALQGERLAAPDPDRLVVTRRITHPSYPAACPL